MVAPAALDELLVALVPAVAPVPVGVELAVAEVVLPEVNVRLVASI